MTTWSSRISVVVPTYNRRDRLHRVLASLNRQDIDEEFEVIVVCDGSPDDTAAYLRSDEVPLRITALCQENTGPAGARNAGIARAHGDLIVFVDDDVVAEPGLLRAHRDAHRRLGRHAVVVGPMLDPPDHRMSSWVAWEQAMLAKQYADMEAGLYEATARQFYTGNASVRKEHLHAVGGFDTAFRRAEDVELAFRLADLGLTFHFEPAARGLHYAERSYEAWKATAYAYGRNDIVFARDRGRSWLYDFAKQRFDSHHAVIRWHTMRAIRSRAWRERSEGVLEWIIRLRPLGCVHRYALSGLYAAELHRGMADELGSAMVLFRILTVGRESEAESS